MDYSARPVRQARADASAAIKQAAVNERKRSFSSLDSKVHSVVLELFLLELDRSPAVLDTNYALHTMLCTLPLTKAMRGIFCFLRAA